MQFTNIKAPWLQNPGVLALKTFVLKKIPSKSERKTLQSSFSESSSTTGTMALQESSMPAAQGG